MQESQVIIQPLLSGTARQAILQSKEPIMFTFKFIEAPLLSLGAVFKIIDHFGKIFGDSESKWKLQLPFLQLLGDMGGLPRAISCLLRVCFGFEYDRGNEFFQSLNKNSVHFEPIFSRVAFDISNRYGIEGLLSSKKEVAAFVLGCAIKKKNVTLDTTFNGTSIGELESQGYIFLHNAGYELYIRMPPIFIFLYNQHLRIIPNELSIWMYGHGSKQSQSWEVFNGLFQIFLNNFFIQENKTVMKLGDLFRGAYGQKETKELLVNLEELEFVESVHQFPSNPKVIDKKSGREIDWPNCKYLILNGESTLGDTICFRKLDRDSAKNYFGEDVKTIIISGHQKWDYNGSEFSLDDAMAEHNKANKTLDIAKEKAAKDNLKDITRGLELCRVITVIFTSQNFPKEEICNIPKDILIVHQGNFKDYYGPFSTHSAFTIAHNVNPNFADISQINSLIN